MQSSPIRRRACAGTIVTDCPEIGVHLWAEGTREGTRVWKTRTYFVRFIVTYKLVEKLIKVVKCVCISTLPETAAS